MFRPVFLSTKGNQSAHLVLHRCIATDRKWYINKYIKIVVASISGVVLVSGGAVAWQVQGLKESLRIKRQSLVDKSKPATAQSPIEDSTQQQHGDKKKILFPWILLRSHKPEVLLRLAQSDDHAVRLLGVTALARDHGWSDEEYAALATKLDHRTIVGLARTSDADPRLFLAPPKQHQTQTALDEQLRRLIGQLPVDHLDRCTKYFTHKAMQECPESKKLERFFWSVIGHNLNIETSRSEFDRMLIYGLTALSEFSFLPSHCGKMVQEGGLGVLQRVYEARDSSVKFLRCIALILANLALHPHLHADIIDAGWVGILRSWVNGRDMELSLKAAKALANLDEDFGAAKKYSEGVYLYHPQTRFSEPVYADIVFVHGLLGGPFKTWRQKDSVYVARAKALEQHKQQMESQKQSEQKQKQGEKSGVTDNRRNIVDKADSSVGAGTQYSCDKHAHAQSEKECSCNKTSKQQSDTTTSTEPRAVKQILRLDKFNIADVDPKAIFGFKKSKEKSKESKSKNWYTFCWPKDWLASDIPNARIVSVGYETYLNEWEAECPYESEKRALSVRSYDMLEKLRQAGIGDRPVIWVGHSMGGLLIKQMLVHAAQDPRYARVAEQSRGVVFYSVPHRGSELARYAKKIQRLYAPSTEVKELVTGCPRLLALNEKFRALVADTALPVLSFAEGQETPLPFNLKLVIVPEESCNPGFGEFHKIAELTHLDICKPESRASHVYRLTLDFIHSCVNFDAVTHVLRASMHDSADDV